MLWYPGYGFPSWQNLVGCMHIKCFECGIFEHLSPLMAVKTSYIISVMNCRFITVLVHMVIWFKKALGKHDMVFVVNTASCVMLQRLSRRGYLSLIQCPRRIYTIHKTIVIVHMELALYVSALAVRCSLSWTLIVVFFLHFHSPSPD